MQDTIQLAYWDGIDSSFSEDSIQAAKFYRELNAVDPLLRARAAFELYGWNDPLFLVDVD